MQDNLKPEASIEPVAGVRLTYLGVAEGYALDAVVTAENAGKLGKGDRNTARLLAGPEGNTTTRPPRW